MSLRLSAALIATLAMAFPGAAAAAKERPEKPRTASPRSGATAEAPVSAAFDVPYVKHVLPNGLTLIIHEDHDAPVAAVNVWYHVGSANEKPGRTGFAHLFEHLMFQGSENHPDEWFKPFERVGATEQNGTTNNDRTNYFQNVPVTALDMTLWLESDRMGHMLGAIDQALLDEQRGVVKNEKRQGENQPYGRAWTLMAEASYPAGHPYSWSVIGSMEDLDAASLDDVKEWFRTWYGPQNAVLVVAGDVNPADVKKKVELYFGDIKPGPPVQRPTEWIAKRTGSRRDVMQDRVPQARLTRGWNVPGWGTPEADYLDIASDVLASGKSSRLWKRLVYDEQVATDVGAYMFARPLGGQFGVQVTAKPGQDIGRIEDIVAEEMAKLLAKGPTAEEVTRVQTVQRAAFIRSLERVGGFGGKSNLLAESQVYGGSPDAWKTSWTRSQSATPEQVHAACKTWLSDGDFVLHVVPFPDAKPMASGADRSRVPDAGAPPAPAFPAFQRASLSNGLKLIVAENRSLPRVEMQLIVDAGYAADQHAKPGTASLMLDMLDEGTTSRDALAISAELDRTGAQIGTSSNLDVSTVSLSALTESLPSSLALFADVVLHPSFPAADLARLKSQRLAGIAREKADPSNAGLRVLPKLIYGERHAYGNPLTGTGTEDAVASLTAADLAAFHSTWFRPNNATLVVVGDVTLASLQPELERLFAEWKPANAPAKNIGAVTTAARPGIYLIDRPGSVQSVILAGHAGPPKSSPDDLAIEAMNRVLGGTFSSRINMNLREDKAWSYGSRSAMSGTRGPRPFYVAAPVQSDRTADSCREIMKELAAIKGDRPVTDEEAQKARDVATLTLPGRWETMSAVAGSLGDLVRFGLPDDYWSTYPASVRSLTTSAMRATTDVIEPSRMVWLVIGDRSKIESGLKDLGLGPVTLLDADGNPDTSSLTASQE